jgi:arsenical pump membrane protein
VLAEALGVVVFVATLVLVVVRPRGISEAWPAALGGLAMVLLGLVSPSTALAGVVANGPLFGFFLGLMLIAAVADDAGFFARTARLAVECAGGSPRRLLVNVFLIGALITAFLTNDATALVLTPVVHILVVRLKLPAAPFIFACSFVADAASFLLPVSNPVNLILLGSGGTALGPFLRHLLLPSVVVLACNLAFFLWFFRRALRGTVDPADMPPDATDPRYLRSVTVALGLIAAGYVAATSLGVPVAGIALAGSALLLGIAWLCGHWRPRRFAHGVSWPLFPFVGGMVLVVEGIERIGLTGAAARWVLDLTGGSALEGVLAVVFGVGIGANLINNVPMALVAASALGALPPDAPNTQALRYAAVLGADLGPNISVVGSLATMLWLLMLRRRGMAISSLDYLRLGILITPLAMVLGALALWGASLIE